MSQAGLAELVGRLHRRAAEAGEQLAVTAERPAQMSGHDKDQLAEDLGLDSMASVDFLSRIEDRYEIDISDSEVVGVVSINDAVDLALHKLNSG